MIAERGAKRPKSLTEALDLLARQAIELQDTSRKIAELRKELADADRGLIALYTELDDARLSAARLAAIVESTHDAIISMTPQCVIQTWNPGAQRLFGHAECQIAGRSAEWLIPTESWKPFTDTLDLVRAGEHPAPYNTRWCRADGTLLDVAVTVSGMLDGEGALIGFSTVARDITALLATQAELAAARADQEVMAERDRIARDLHDMVIPRVFGAGLALRVALALDDLPESTARIKAVSDELYAAIRALRGAVFDLRYPQQAGLRTQLDDLTGTAQRCLGFPPTVSLEGPVDSAVTDEIAIHLLAVLREALSNIARHAAATAVDVTLQAGDDLVLQVSDNGRGFDTATRTSGLANMRERARLLGGWFEVESRAGAGTRLRWRVPLPPSKSPG